MPQLIGNSLALTRLGPFGTIGGGGADHPGAFPVNAVNFDGTNDNLIRGAGLTGAVDGENLLLSIWINLVGGNDTTQYIFGATSDRLILRRRSDNKFVVRLFNSVPATLWEASVDDTYSTSSNPGWHHLLIAAELDASPVGQIYIDDVAAAHTNDEALTNGDIDWTHADHTVGSEVTELFRLNADLAEVYLTNEYLDISVVSNRRRFIDARGFPVDLGSDGSTPTGTAALIFFSGATDSWHTNKGSGGGFTETGALTDAATSPSD